MRFVALEIGVQQVLEPGQDVFVHLATCDKLPFVEAHAVIQQQFDITRDQAFAVLIYRVCQFLLYLIQAIPEDSPFLFRQVKGFVGGV